MRAGLGCFRAALVDNVRAGATLGDLLQHYPQLSIVDIAEALAWAIRMEAAGHGLD